jgi:hypothetical protein
MSKRSVFCVASSRGRADRILHDLKEAEFASTEISVLFLDSAASEARAAAGKASAPSGAAVVRPAGEIRGVLGWIDGIRSLAIPGVGPLIAAGPVAAVLSSRTVGGIAGGLADFDVPNVEASRYEAKIKEGQILIAVHSENPEKSDQAREIFNANEAEAVFTMIDVFTPRTLLKGASGPQRESAA